MHVCLYHKVMKIKEPKIPGGQELIYGEIIGSLQGIKRIFLPFPNDFLIGKLESVGIKVVGYDGQPQAVYFGTPTIVNDRNLFFAGGQIWNKKQERKVVRAICKHAKDIGVKKIVCGLGSGDISVSERQADVKAGCGKVPKVICMKDFGEFKDWVMEVNL